MTTDTKPIEIANLASSAKSADDYQQLLSRVQAELDKAEDHLSALEARRKDVVLSGEDVDAYHRDLLTAAEKVKTLTAAVDAVTDQYETALAKEAKANLEAQARRVQAKSVPAYQSAFGRLLKAMDEVLKACDEITVYRDEIDGLNEIVDRKSRADLRISVSRLRADAVAKLAGSDKSAAPVRVDRMPGETDDAFDLRLNNARDTASRKAQAADPVRAKGEQAILAIQANAFEMGAHERFRNMRVINTKSFIGPYGEAVLKVQNADSSLGEPGHKVSHPDIRSAMPDGNSYRGMPSSNA